MAASRKLPSVDTALLAPLRGKRLAIGLSGGIDSVVLLHVLRALQPQFRYRLSSVHVNHGISPNAGGWEKFCSVFCRDLEVPLTIRKIKVVKQRKGLEAAARDARREALSKLSVDAIALAHHLDDQAETVLLNLLRGAGIEGASGMAAQSRLGKKLLLRPLLAVTRAEISAYAAEHQLGWVEDESNRDTALTRNFLRREVGPVLESRFPRWRESLARAARHLAKERGEPTRQFRKFLESRGLKAPSESRLAEMLKQAAAGRGAIKHDGVTLRFYRGKVFSGKEKKPSRFKPKTWNGESRLSLPDLGGELQFKRVRGQGIDAQLKPLQVRLRSGGERLKLDARRPHRTLKNLFQEAGIPPWERERLPLLYRGEELVWAPGLGVDVKFLAASRADGLMPEWNAFKRSG
jgi:tRNA(Ile)-lysidine synthase